MTRILYFLTLILFLTGWSALAAEAKSADAPSRKELLQQVGSSCRDQLADDLDNPAPVCDCITRNLDQELGTADLELLARSHAGDQKAAEEVSRSHEKLLLLDYDIGQGCQKSTGFRYRH